MLLDRYIARAVFKGVFIAMLIFIGLFIFIDFIGQIKFVGTGDYDNLKAALYVFLRLPQRFYQLAPSIILLGGILSMGPMASNSELIVMRASGISMNRITRSVLQAGLLIALFIVLIGEFVAPIANRTAETLRAEALEKKLIVGGYNDIWARDGNRYINVKRVLPDQQLREINIYELNEKKQLTAIVFAQSARFENNEWVVKGIKRTTITRHTDLPGGLPETNVSFVKQRIMPHLILLELFKVLELAAEDMSANDLYTYSKYLEENNLDANEYKLAFWIKLLMPATCLAMLLIAMPLVFSTTPRSGGVGKRIVLALIIGIVFYVLSRSMNFLGLAIGLAPFISAATPLVLAITTSILILKRMR